MHTKIGTEMLKIMKENDLPVVMWGDGILGEAFDKAGARVKVPHPLNRMQAVLNALARDSRFEKSYVRIDIGIADHWQRRLVRCFRISP